MNLYTVLALPAILLTTTPQPFNSGTTTTLSPIEISQSKAKLSFGNGIDMIVKGLGLNIDNIRFIKEPKATDYVPAANNKAGYAQSLIIAANNGIKLNRALKPEAVMTREQFAVHLNEAIQSTGQYPVNMMFIIIKDEKSFAPGASSAVQNLIKFKVAALENGSFRPKAPITPAEATKMVKNAAAFVQAHRAGNKEPNASAKEVVMTSAAVSADVNRITLSRGTKPNSGYQIMITRVDFLSKGEAVVHYELADPKEGNSYLQVITEPRAETYISSFYKVVLKQD